MPSDDFLKLNPGAAALLKSRRPRQKKQAPPSAPQGTRAPAGWAQDYEEAGRQGWQFAVCVEGGAMLCYAWRSGGGRTAVVAYLGDYATAAGVYRLAVVEALSEDRRSHAAPNAPIPYGE